MKELYNVDVINNSLKRLDYILRDSDAINGILFQPFCNTMVTDLDFTKKSLKRAVVTGSKFIGCRFNGVAATSSKFSDVSFQNCDFSGANFQHCQFYNVFFGESALIKGANFSQSIFVGCVFEGVSIVESTLDDCRFENCKILSSIISLTTFENTLFCKCFLKSIDMSYTNLEYSKMVSINMNNVILPPYQIPYIIGATSYLKDTSDTIHVYTDNGNIPINEYKGLYNDLSAYFFKHKSYFPLANILIACGKLDVAYDYLKLGIQESCDYFDFRMIKHYCRLACSCSQFTYSQLKSLYDMITELSYSQNWDINVLHSYMIHISEIKEILLNNHDNSHRVDIVIKTDIDATDTPTINQLYNEINSIIHNSTSSTNVNAIEIRHNSPYELYITCIDNLPSILLLISSLYSLFVVGNKGLDFAKKLEDTIRVHQQNEYHKYEVEEKRLLIALKQEELRSALYKNHNNPYKIVQVEHTINCETVSVTQDIPQEYLHHKETNSETTSEVNRVN